MMGWRVRSVKLNDWKILFVGMFRGDNWGRNDKSDSLVRSRGTMLPGENFVPFRHINKINSLTSRIK